MVEAVLVHTFKQTSGSTSVKVYIGGRFRLYLYICILMYICELMPVSATAVLNILVMLASLSSPQLKLSSSTSFYIIQEFLFRNQIFCPLQNCTKGI